jgi:DNA polymerase-3 subunit epsilon
MFAALKKKLNRRGLKDTSYEYLFDMYEGDEVVVFDCETTGLDTKKDEILSIGAVKIRNNKVVTSEMFEVFVKPSGVISGLSITIHHIRPCDLENALEPKDAVMKFLDFIGNRPLVGYYLEFDVAMVNRYVKEYLGITLPNQQIEVSGLYFDKKIALIPQGNIDLRFDTILRNLQVPQMGQHNAVNDAIMTAMIYLKLKS